MMRIVQINTTFPEGSTGKIVKNLHDYYISKGIDSYVLCGRGSDNGRFKQVGNEFLYKVNALRSRMTGIMYGGCFWSTQYIIKFIQEKRPDIVHLHCLNGNFCNIYRLVSWLKKNKVNTVLTLHAEFMYTANCGYALDCNRYQSGCGKCPRLKQETKTWFIDGTHKSWKLMRESFNGFNTIRVVSVSPWLKERAQQSAILKGLRNDCIYNGVDTNIFKFKMRPRESDYKIIFHVTAFFTDKPDSIKGGRFIISLARLFIDEKVKVVVAGCYDKKLEVPDNVIMLGQIADQTILSDWYEKADITVLTSKKETFSMVTVESLCCGTPVVGFKAGAPEVIALPEYSTFVEYADVRALYSAVCAELERTHDKKRIAWQAKQIYSETRMGKEYIQVYEELTREGNREDR